MDNLVLGFAAVAVGTGLGIILVFSRRGSDLVELPRREQWLQRLLSPSQTQSPPKGDQGQ